MSPLRKILDHGRARPGEVQADALQADRPEQSEENKRYNVM